MKTVKQAWQSLSLKVKLAVVGLVAIGVVAALVAALTFANGLAASISGKNNGGGHEHGHDHAHSHGEAGHEHNPAGGGEAPEREKVDWGEVDSQRAGFDVSKVKLDRDEFGMVEFVKTSDPRVAAASAAAVMFNVDFTKQTKHEYFDNAINRLTLAGEKHSGPVGEISVWPKADDNGKVEFHTGTGQDILHHTVHVCALEPIRSRPCVPWLWANQNTYNDYAQHAGRAIARPVLVMDEAEMKEWSPKTVIKTHPTEDATPDSEGATFAKYWVLSEVSIGGEGTDPETMPPAQLGLSIGVWCDAPEDGGLCSVVYLGRFLPNAWPY